MKNKVIFYCGTLAIILAAVCILSSSDSTKWLGVALSAILGVLSRTKIGTKYATSCNEATEALERFLQRL